MTKEDRFIKELSDIPDTELAKLAEKAVFDMCQSGGRSFTMTVPPRVTDSDMLLSELIERFKRLISEK